AAGRRRRRLAGPAARPALRPRRPHGAPPGRPAGSRAEGRHLVPGGGPPPHAPHLAGVARRGGDAPAGAGVATPGVRPGAVVVRVGARLRRLDPPAAGPAAAVAGRRPPTAPPRPRRADRPGARAG